MDAPMTRDYLRGFAGGVCLMALLFFVGAALLMRGESPTLDECESKTTRSPRK